MSQEAVVNKRIQGTQNRSKLRTTIQIAMLGAGGYGSDDV